MVGYSMKLPNINENCSKTFKYRDFIECSDTYKKTLVNNIPKNLKTYEAIQKLANELLEKIVAEFGSIQLTYGFCGSYLQKEIKKNIYPKLDQHAGYELSKRGDLVCKREGFAVDFLVENISSLFVSRWIIQNCIFDRLYYYGAERPLHISYSNNNLSKIILMRFRKVRVVPQVIKTNDFLNSNINF